MLPVKTKMNLLKLVFVIITLAASQSMYAQSNRVLVNAKSDFKLELVGGISITELLAMKPAKYVITKSHGFFDIREFGYEWFPNDGKMKVAFLVSAGLGDLAEEPLAAKIWVPLDKTVIFDEMKSKERQLESKLSVAVFCLASADKKQKTCVEMIINKSGEVYFDEQLIGKLDL